MMRSGARHKSLLLTADGSTPTCRVTGCTKLTDTVLQHLSSLTALTELHLRYTSTTQTGRNALEAALPALTIY